MRQTEIVRMLVGVARAAKEPDLVRQHAVEALRTFAPLTDDKVKITVASWIAEQFQGRPLQAVEMKIAAAIDTSPLSQAAPSTPPSMTESATSS